MSSGSSSVVLPSGGAAERAAMVPLYRPFFRAGILFVLTLGAAWGALLLVRIAQSGSFTATSLQEVNAHGHAQIFGWVGLFVMGFLLYGLPWLRQAPLVAPRLAMACFGLMAGGVLLRSGAQALIDSAPWLLVPALAGSLAEIAAIAGCGAIVLATLGRGAGGLRGADGFLLTALGWFFLQAVYGTVYFVATVQAADTAQLLHLVATWQAPLREIQIHGLAMLMILGVSQMILPRFYGTRPVGARWSIAALAVINLALIGVVAGLLGMRLGGSLWGGVWYLSVLAMAAATAALVWKFQLLRPLTQGDRSLKFLRAAYAWLLVSLAMLLLLPVYQFALLPRLAPESRAAAIGFSHAYYGAIRHAVTVGYVSLMIMGVAARVVPEFTGKRLADLPALWLPWALLNGGCALRVIGQTATDFTTAAFPVTGASGLIELAGLTIWGVHLWRLMDEKAPAAEELAAADSPDATPRRDADGTPPQVEPDDVVADVLARHPQLLDTFVEAGFTPLRNPVVRERLARLVTVRQACGNRDVNLESFLATLNRRLADGDGNVPLPAHAEQR